jgi:hypothetical protein
MNKLYCQLYLLKILDKARYFFIFILLLLFILLSMYKVLQWLIKYLLFSIVSLYKWINSWCLSFKSQPNDIFDILPVGYATILFFFVNYFHRKGQINAIYRFAINRLHSLPKGPQNKTCFRSISFALSFFNLSNRSTDVAINYLSTTIEICFETNLCLHKQNANVFWVARRATKRRRTKRYTERERKNQKQKQAALPLDPIKYL